VVTNDGSVGIGTLTPEAKIHTLTTTASGNQEIHDNVSDSAGGPSIVFRKARGTVGSLSAVSSGDALGVIGARGYGSSGYSTLTRSNIGFLAEENWTDSAQGSNITFTTTAPGGTTRTEKLRITGTGNIGIGTTTPGYNLTISSSTIPQLSLSAGAGLAQTVFRNTGTSFYISTTTVAGTATTSTPALEIALGGFGTTTLRGLNISGFATSTSNVGFNITGGCYAVNGTCLTLASLGGSAFPFTSQANYNSTSTPIGFTSGLFSLSSTTLNGTKLSDLSQGYAFVGTNGLVGTVSTSTLASQIFTAQTFAPNSIITTSCRASCGTYSIIKENCRGVGNWLKSCISHFKDP
jgi:hypothetical protein